jgi:diguanylate cyclase (GGDEF)-like protein
VRDGDQERNRASEGSGQSANEQVRWWELLIAFFVLLLCSWLGIRLSRHSEGVATIWLTNGMLFALVVTRPRRVWPYYFVVGLLADTLADVLYGDPLKLAFGVSLANSIEVILSSVLLTYWFGSPFNLSKRRPLLGFLGVAVIGATAVTGALGASWTLLFVDAGSWWTGFRNWYLGDVLGMAIMAPLVFGLLRPGFFDVLQPKRLVNTLGLLMIPAASTFLVFMHDEDPLIFFIFPALLFVVFRLGFPGAVLAIFVIALISITLTVEGHGPLMLIRDSHMLHRIVVVQIFLAVSLFTAFPVAALLEDRKTLEASLQQSEARYRILANADGLTGLANRRWFDESLCVEWRRAVENRTSLGLLLADVDLFKSYNDLCGHLGGDDCLRQIARKIAETVPPQAGTPSRIGGEEFAVILPKCDVAKAAELAGNLRASIEEMRLPHEGNPLGIQTLSIGVAAGVPDASGKATDLVAAADDALYCAKRLGRNRVEISDSRTSFLDRTMCEDDNPVG